MLNQTTFFTSFSLYISFLVFNSRFLFQKKAQEALNSKSKSPLYIYKEQICVSLGQRFGVKYQSLDWLCAMCSWVDIVSLGEYTNAKTDTLVGFWCQIHLSITWLALCRTLLIEENTKALKLPLFCFTPSMILVPNQSINYLIGSVSNIVKKGE